MHDLVIHEDDASRIDGVLGRFLSDGGVSAAVLIDRSGQPLAQATAGSELDTESIGALAAGAFSSTGALARLLGEDEFSVLFHEGKRESLHVSAVGEQAILLAVFGEGTTIGMVRLFAKEACGAIATILSDARSRPRRAGALATPLTPDETGRSPWRS